MRLLVCVKQVPDGPVGSKNVGLTLDRKNIRQCANLADKCALEAALTMKADASDTVTLLSMGRPEAEGMLRELLQTGADEAVLVTDAAAAGGDTLATARVIASAARALGGFDLILMGRRAADGETGHIGPETAQMLGYYCLTDAVALRRDGDGLLCQRLLEDERLTVRAPLPAVVTVSGGYLLRPPSIAAMRSASGKAVRRLSLCDAGLESALAGARGSATEVKRVWSAAPPIGRCEMYTDIEKGAEAVLELLRHPPEAARERVEVKYPPSGGRALVVSLVSDALSLESAPELVFAARRCYEDVRQVVLGGGGEDDATAVRALARYMKENPPELVLFPATVRCRAVAPMCAALLGLGLTADCTGLEPDGRGGCVMTRPTFGGGLMAEIVCLTRPAMATVRPGVFEPDADPSESVTLAPEGEARAVVLASVPSETPRLAGDIVVSGGKGLRDKAGFQKAAGLAGLLGASLGASRGAVDGGLISYPHQVGQTGATIRPRVYLALGISGAVQHMAGVRAAAVAAVNLDPKAPIFDRAAVGVVGDCGEFMDTLTKKIRMGDTL